MMVRPNKTQPVQTTKADKYGDRIQEEERLQKMPLPKSVPGEAGNFNRITERPNEPITSGLDQGLGAGSEMVVTPQSPMDEEAKALNKNLTAMLPLLEMQAANADTSSGFRSFVRDIRHRESGTPTTEGA